MYWFAFSRFIRRRSLMLSAFLLTLSAAKCPSSTSRPAYWTTELIFSSFASIVVMNASCRLIMCSACSKLAGVSSLARMCSCWDKSTSAWRASRSNICKLRELDSRIFLFTHIWCNSSQPIFRAFNLSLRNMYWVSPSPASLVNLSPYSIIFW